MDKLKFYEVSKDYLNFLRKYDPKVPNQDYKKNKKFFCGIVLKINGYNYFVPVSHFTTPQYTNYIIKKDKKSISSLRFCFMIPVPNDDSILTYKDFSNETNINYVKLLDIELTECRNNVEEIKKIALKTYKIGCNDKHPLNKTCCSFSKLEEVMDMYVREKVNVKTIEESIIKK